MPVKKKTAKKTAKKKASGSKSKSSSKKKASKSELTHIIAVLDRSGSMRKVAEDAIGGFNTFIEEQKKLKDKTTFSGVLFDDVYEPLYNGKVLDSQYVPELTAKEFFPRNTTALYHSIGKAVTDYKNIVNGMKKSEKPSKVLVFIVTDGRDNVHGEFSREDVADMIKYQKTQNWQFLFLCSTEDAVTVGADLNVSAGNVFKHEKTGKGNKDVYSKISFAAASYRGMDTSTANFNSDSLLSDEKNI